MSGPFFLEIVMPAPLNVDAVAYLKQQGRPVNAQSLNQAMGLLNQQPNLRPSYAGQTGSMDMDVETMKPTRIEGKPLPPLQADSNTNQSFGQAFKAARKKLGAGQVFDWNGKKYNTNFKEEVESGSVDTPHATNGIPKKGKGDVGGQQIDITKYDEDGDIINDDEDKEIQQGLAEEDAEFAAQDQKKRNTKRVSAGRGGYVDVPMDDSDIANRDMNNMLDTMLGVGAGAGVAGAAGMAVRGNKEPASYRAMPVDPTNPAVKGVGSSPDLAGGYEAEKPPVNQTDEMSEMFKDVFPDENKKFVEGVLKDAETYLPEEQAAAKAALSGDKKRLGSMIERLKALGGDKKLIKALQAMM